MTSRDGSIRAHLAAILGGAILAFALSGEAKAGGFYRYHDQGHVQGYYKGGVFSLFFGYPYDLRDHRYYAPRHRHHVYKGRLHRYEHPLRKHHFRKHHFRKHHLRKHHFRKHRFGLRHGRRFGHRRYGYRD